MLPCLISKRLSQLKNLYEGERKLPKTGVIEVDELGFHWRLNMDSYIGRTIAEQGVFEPDTTKLVQEFVKPGMHVLDIGANIGYYTLILARAVGPTGIVWAFEPVTKYRDYLKWHVRENGFSSRVRIIPYGLSDKLTNCSISIEDTSATLHWSGDMLAPENERITLNSLDAIADELDIRRIDFIKIDVDGHEPQVLLGASKLLQQYLPPISLEFAQHCLHIAGSDVRIQARILQELGYVICSEKTRKPYKSEMQFLMECGNFDHSCNALAISNIES